MASPGGDGFVVTIGGKGATLSPASVYAVSRGLSRVQIDSSALEKLSQSSKRPSPLSPQPPSAQNPRSLTLEESRAALVILLNKLLLSDAAVRPALPFLIEQNLTLESNLDRLDFGSSSGFLTSLCQLNGKNLDEIGVSKEEISVVENCLSLAASVGICAVLDSLSSSLVRLSDALAALSCEAAKADVAIFDLPASADGNSDKDESDVASDMKVLLFGSKLVGKVDSRPFSDIPTAHGSFREAARALHKRTRVELNSAVRVKKPSAEKESVLVTSVLPLARCVKSLIEMSLGRVRSSMASIGDQELQSKVVGVFEEGCPGLHLLKEKLNSVLGNIVSGSDSVVALREVYQMLVKYREVLAWEAALALFALEVDDTVEKIQVGPSKGVTEDGDIAKGDKKGEKKKKKTKTLGRGTSTVRQLVRERLMNGNEAAIDNVTVLAEWVQKLMLYFDPKEVEFDTLLNKVKEIVESNEVRRLPKIPKGTRDFGKEEMAVRERAFSIITRVFKRHGGVALDTPVFELRETLMGKYGEDSKLIYDLADQGGELCSLRYDLTVPFARYLAMNGITSMKRYQIAKVYRRDNPSKGRYREFYQCDFDIAGQYETMEPDFEVIKVLSELLDELNIGEYEIKLNHRKLLDGMLEICGVSSEKFRTVCSSIDKLDKQSFDQIKKELVEEKGLSVETAEKIGTFVKRRGPPLDVLSELKSRDSQFLENPGSVLALNDLEILFKALEKSKCLDRVVFDLSLARGLDYYTGVIYEAVFKGSAQVGSIAAGGRYDNLVGMFSGKQLPAVGVSLGIERVFTIMEQLEKEGKQATRATETQVLVAILAKDVPLAAEVVNELWDAKIPAEFGLNKNPRKHIDRAIDSGIPWMVTVGESELRSGIFKLKNIEAKEQEEVPRDRLVEELRKRLNIV